MARFKFLVNTTNLRTGGGLQKAVQFFLGCRTWGDEHLWRFVLSPQLEDQLAKEYRPDWISCRIANESPARIFGGWSARRLLASQEREFDPHAVFSVFGPSYHRFRRPHLMGFAIPWITNPSALAWTTLPTGWHRLAFQLRLRYYAHWARLADAWVLETASARDGLVENLQLDGPAHVVPNSCSDYYEEAAQGTAEPHPGLPAKRDGDVLLLCFTSYKPHKNLEFIPDVALRLKEVAPRMRHRFVFSLPGDSPPWRKLRAKAERLDVADRLLTVGRVPVAGGPGLYAGCDAIFMPTVLEVFSATYPEAMAMERPILTSDLPFARDVCGEAAAYFDPTDADSAAAAVLDATGDSAFGEKLVVAGRTRLKDFGTSESRFRAVLGHLTDLAVGSGRSIRGFSP